MFVSSREVRTTTWDFGGSFLFLRFGAFSSDRFPSCFLLHFFSFLLGALFCEFPLTLLLLTINMRGCLHPSDTHSPGDILLDRQVASPRMRDLQHPARHMVAHRDHHSSNLFSGADFMQVLYAPWQGNPASPFFTSFCVARLNSTLAILLCLIRLWPARLWPDFWPKLGFHLFGWFRSFHLFLFFWKE